MKRLNNTHHLLTALLACALLSSCKQSPQCPDSLISKPAVSAGCLVIEQEKLLIVESRNGIVSIPGGSANANEPSHCAAHRETWEETGLNVTPTQLMRVFDNGFHLYRCRWQGEQTDIEPPFFLEIKRAFWIDAEEFDQFQWRFPQQALWLHQILVSEDQRSTIVPAQD